MSDPKVMQFPATAHAAPTSLLTLSSLRKCLEQSALDLAVASDLLSLRLSRDRNAPVTPLMSRRYKVELAQLRTLLDHLQSSMDQLISHPVNGSDSLDYDD